jgi:hypothetical protein
MRNAEWRIAEACVVSRVVGSSAQSASSADRPVRACIRGVCVVGAGCVVGYVAACPVTPGIRAFAVYAVVGPVCRGRLGMP